MMVVSTLPLGGRTRLAPTPSSYLHVGNAFNFLVTDRLAKAFGMALVLRIDDLDSDRTRPEYISDIFYSLEWLGIQCDEGPSGPEEFSKEWSQIIRIGRYQTLVDELRERGAVYPCACSRSQFEERQKSGASHSCRTGPYFDVPQGTPWRLRITEDVNVFFRHLGGSVQRIAPATLMTDPIVQQRENGRPAYQIASLSDDLDLGINMIVRGADLLPSTGCQLFLAQVLGRERFPEVRFHHHPLSLDPAGHKLSKSAGAGSLKAMRDARSSPAPLIAAAEHYVDGLLGGIKA